MNKVDNILAPYFVESLSPLIDASRIMLFVVREIQDYSIFRTENGGELNNVVTKKTYKQSEPVTRVVFKGEKQNAKENRQMRALLEAAAKEAQFEIKPCFHKDDLCLECPRCTLYGGTNVKKSENVNIQHRILYSSAFSLNPIDKIEEVLHFNAVYDLTNHSGQAFGHTHAVTPNALFPSIVTLAGVTQEEFVLAIKTLLSTRRYGAMASKMGVVRNHLIGIAAGWEEFITSLELSLSLADCASTLEQAQEKLPVVLDFFRKGSSEPHKVRIITGEALQEVIEDVQDTPLDKAFLEKAFAASQAYRNFQHQK